MFHFAGGLPKHFLAASVSSFRCVLESETMLRWQSPNIRLLLTSRNHPLVRLLPVEKAPKYMSYSLNSLKGGYIGDQGTTIGVIKGDTRSLDYSSYEEAHTKFL